MSNRAKVKLRIEERQLQVVKKRDEINSHLASYTYSLYGSNLLPYKAEARVHFLQQARQSQAQSNREFYGSGLQVSIGNSPLHQISSILPN